MSVKISQSDLDMICSQQDRTEEAKRPEALSEEAASDLLADLGAPLVSEQLAAPTSHYSPGITSSVEERALSLLGAGVQQEQVAIALGVSPSRISQLLSDKTFADKVATLRYTALQKHNARDSKYDTIEDRLLDKLSNSLSLLVKPESILRAMHVVNNAKRRGSSAPEQVVNQQTVVNLVLPSFIKEKFAVNIDNQVIRAGEQELLTISAKEMLNKVEGDTSKQLEAPYEHASPS